MQGSAWTYRGLLRIAGTTADLITAIGSAEPFQYLSQMQMQRSFNTVFFREVKAALEDELSNGANNGAHRASDGDPGAAF